MNKLLGNRFEDFIRCAREKRSVYFSGWNSRGGGELYESCL